MDVYLKKRWDLIPNLVETVKGYAKHEESVFEKVAGLRTSWAGAKTVEEKAEVAGQMSGVLRSIMAVSESYPELKANQNFLDLQGELKETENKMSFARQFYNDVVTKFNTKISVIPTNIVAGLFHFTAEKLFEVQDEEAKKNVKVQF